MDFLNSGDMQNFNEKLKQPLFYNNEKSLRFDFLRMLWFRNVRAIIFIKKIVNNIFSNNKTLLINEIALADDDGDCPFLRYVDQKAKLLGKEIYDFNSDDDGYIESCEMIRYLWAVDTDKIKWVKLIRDLCTSKNNKLRKHLIYIVNPLNGMVMNIYDHRGMDVVYDSVDKMKEHYVKYYNWISEYDRETIELVFKNS